MDKYQERVVNEKNELDIKLNSLQAFIAGILFETLDEAEQRRLKQQELIMGLYSDVLNERIEAFTSVVVKELKKEVVKCSCRACKVNNEEKEK